MNSATSLLDPAFARNPQNIWPIQQIFNGLVEPMIHLTLSPKLPIVGKLTPGTVYTFHLMKIFFFIRHHNSKEKKRKVIASDFVYSFNRLL